MHTTTEEDSARVRRALRRSRLNIPMFPAAAQRVMAQLGNPHARTGHLAEIIESDGALATEVLRLANSPAFMGGNSITTVKRAVVQLGLGQLRSLLFMTLHKALFPVGMYRQLQATYTHQALAVAAACEALSTQIQWPNPEQAEASFLYGILHNIGRFGLFGVIRQLQAEGALPTPLAPEAIEAIIDRSYAECGHAMAQSWKLPVVFEEVIAFHREPTLASSRCRAPVALTHVAIALCASYGIGGVSCFGDEVERCPALPELGLEVEHLDQAADVAEARFEQLKEAF